MPYIYSLGYGKLVIGIYRFINALWGPVVSVEYYRSPFGDNHPGDAKVIGRQKTPLLRSV